LLCAAAVQAKVLASWISQRGVACLALLVPWMCAVRAACRLTRVLAVPAVVSLCLLGRRWRVPVAKHSWWAALCMLHRLMPLCLVRFLSPPGPVGCPPRLALLMQVQWAR
jgi:hypothetical protein